jgi:flavin reductase (DIM6/NTAB) family NADH-FMN oxidoreductase RutF
VTPRRTEFDADALATDGYALLNSAVVPRPIAWVSTRSADGVDNLAPHSWFTVASVKPPVVSITSSGGNDTLANVRATGEFVVAVATEALMGLVNDTATDFPAGVSEFAAAGLHAEPAAAVRPPRIAESPVALECRVVATQSFGHPDSGTTVVFGEVVHLAVDPAVLREGLPDVELLRPVSRLNRNLWATLGRLIPLDRIQYRDWVERNGS